MAPTDPRIKGTWFVIWAAFTVAPVVYYFVGAAVAGGVVAAPAFPMFLALLSAFAIVTLAAGAILVTRAPRARDEATGLGMYFGGRDLAPPARFQVAFVLGAALIEACSVYGFVLLFLGAPLGVYAWFGAGTLAVMLGIALPVGLAYFRAREQGDTGGPPPIG